MSHRLDQQEAPARRIVEIWAPQPWLTRAVVRDRHRYRVALGRDPYCDTMERDSDGIGHQLGGDERDILVEPRVLGELRRNGRRHQLTSIGLGSGRRADFPFEQHGLLVIHGLLAFQRDPAVHGTTINTVLPLLVRNVLLAGAAFGVDDRRRSIAESEWPP